MTTARATVTVSLTRITCEQQ